MGGGGPAATVEKVKAVPGSKAEELYGLANGYLACHAFNKTQCSKSDKECKFTHQYLPKSKRDALPEKPLKKMNTPRGKSASAKGGRSQSPYGGKGKKGKGKDKGEPSDKTFGKGGRAPMCCYEFVSSGKCTYQERTGMPCAQAHLTSDKWKEEYKRINPGK